MGEQRRRAQDDARAKKTGHADVSAYRNLLDAAGPTRFTGYTETSSPAAIRGLLVDGASVHEAAVGSDVDVVLDRSPFYAEAGGQLADAGRIVLDDGTTIEIDDVQAPVPGLFVHRGRVVAGLAALGAGVLAEVDLERRRSISRAHTATHMVHKAFREALGDTATQAGSENAPGRFRFDFAATGAVPASVLVDVEDRVNQLLADDLLVTSETMPIEEARRSGAMALFGEKYGDVVRVVSVGDWARELCGGTHAERSGQLGVITLLGESSIGSGVRRVEALVGVDAYRFLAREHLLVRRLTETLKTRPDELSDRVGSLIERLKATEREIARLRADRLKAGLGELAAAAVDVDGVAVAAFRAPDGTTGAEVREAVLDVRSRLAGRPCVVVGAAAADEKVSAVAATDEAARARGLSARGVLADVLAAVDGRGGGKDDVAQGGGNRAESLDTALAAVVPLVRATVGS
jgi:alanyl-tRNA synthetase